MRASETNSFPRRFGPYVLVQFLDEGGMGRVYLALQGTSASHGPCVVKFMGSAYANQRSMKLEERFQREVSIAKSLSHPYIANTFHAGISDEGPFLVQEFVHGQSLRSLASSVADEAGHLEIPLAVHIVCLIAEALQYLHDFRGQGIVHRDVTPENVMLSFTGDVKLIDFGVAKSTVRDPNLTAVGGWVGKPHWTAPEVSKGGRLDRRADVYALGVLLWYLLTGKDPATTIEHFEKDTGPLPPPSRLHRELPPELDRIVSKALSIDPATRYQTTMELRHDLISFIPSGFEAQKELSACLERFSSHRKEEFLQDLLATGVPLLSKVPTKIVQTNKLKRTSSTWSRIAAHWRLGGYIALLLAAFAVVFYYAARTFWAMPQIALPVPSVETPTVPAKSESPVIPSRALPEPKPVVLHTVDASPVQAQPSQPHARGKGRAVAAASPAAQKAISAEEILGEARDFFERAEFPQALSLARLAAAEGGGTKAQILIGSILMIQRDIPGARAAFEKALEMSPGNKEAQRYLERLSR